MVLVDTSVWVDVFRDPDGLVRDALVGVTGDDDTVLTRFNQLELLQGARDEHEWSVLAEYLEHQDYLDAGADTWRNAPAEARGPASGVRRQTIGSTMEGEWWPVATTAPVFVPSTNGGGPPRTSPLNSSARGIGESVGVLRPR